MDETITHTRVIDQIKIMSIGTAGSLEVVIDITNKKEPRIWRTDFTFDDKVFSLHIDTVENLYHLFSDFFMKITETLNEMQEGWQSEWVEKLGSD